MYALPPHDEHSNLLEALPYRLFSLQDLQSILPVWANGLTTRFRSPELTAI